MRKIGEIQQDISQREQDFPNGHYELSKLYSELSRAYLVEDDRGYAFAAMKKAFFYLFLNEDSYEGMTVFSFRGFSDFSVADITKGEISISHPGKFNDPLDTILYRWLERKAETENDLLEKDVDLLLLRAAQYLKVRCFVIADPDKAKDGKLPVETLNPLMWAHYADSHKGFCAEYEIPDGYVTKKKENLTFTRFGSVVYKDISADMDKLTLQEALFWKSDVWSYEHEFRLVNLNYDCEKDFVEIAAPKLTAIYLGLKCSTENEERMKVALRMPKNQGALLYRMVYDENAFGGIMAKRIW